ncbi:MAG: hypothetical protein PHU98_06090 [Mariniphaga sp.]|nr:hypothetical protein [Mariniphaga sp.]
MKTKYFAVKEENRFEPEIGHFSLFTIEKTAKTKKAIENWITKTGNLDCQIMTEKQYENALLSQNI